MLMKRDAIYAGVLALGLLAAGCKESLPDRFGPVEGVYFNNRQANNMLVDSVSYTFVYEDSDEMKVPVRVQLVGRVSDVPRPVAIRISSSDAEEGTDYRAEGEAVLPAGSNSFDYTVTLLRTDVLKERSKTLLLELAANDYFILPFTHQTQSGGDRTSAVTFRIDFSDRFTAPPAGWRTTFIGSFSQQKFELICDVMKLPRADFNEVGKITDAKWMFIQSRMYAYVRDQQDLKAAGKPYDARAFDEAGNPLTFD